jgi:hypothetical protein
LPRRGVSLERHLEKRFDDRDEADAQPDQPSDV